jgi:heme/copper-type cytochrome/quinol oxidase subunit 2
MRSAVHVLPPAQFQQWLQSQRTGSSAAAGGATTTAGAGTGAATGLRAAAE